MGLSVYNAFIAFVFSGCVKFNNSKICDCNQILLLDRQEKAKNKTTGLVRILYYRLFCVTNLIRDKSKYMKDCSYSGNPKKFVVFKV